MNKEEIILEVEEPSKEYKSGLIEEMIKRNIKAIDEYTFEMLIRENIELQQKVNQLETKINTYENPEDMTLMFMWCDEKAKDKIKQLKEKINQLETNRDEAIHNIKYKENIIKSFPNSIRGIDFSDLISILERGKE